MASSTITNSFHSIAFLLAVLFLGNSNLCSATSRPLLEVKKKPSTLQYGLAKPRLWPSFPAPENTQTPPDYGLPALPISFQQPISTPPPSPLLTNPSLPFPTLPTIPLPEFPRFPKFPPFPFIPTMPSPPSSPLSPLFKNLGFSSSTSKGQSSP